MSIKILKYLKYDVYFYNNSTIMTWNELILQWLLFISTITGKKGRASKCSGYDARTDRTKKEDHVSKTNISKSSD